MSGMVVILVPAIGKDALRDMIVSVSVMRGNDCSIDGGEDASDEQEKEEHGRNWASKEPWQEKDCTLYSPGPVVYRMVSR